MWGDYRITDGTAIGKIKVNVNRENVEKMTFGYYTHNKHRKTVIVLIDFLVQTVYNEYVPYFLFGGAIYEESNF